MQKRVVGKIDTLVIKKVLHKIQTSTYTLGEHKKLSYSGLKYYTIKYALQADFCKHVIVK